MTDAERIADLERRLSEAQSEIDRKLSPENYAMLKADLRASSEYAGKLAELLRAVRLTVRSADMWSYEFPDRGTRDLGAEIDAVLQMFPSAVPVQTQAVSGATNAPAATLKKDNV